MSIPRRITEFLDSQRVPYEHSTHHLAYTAQEVAHAQHVSGKAFAKAVMVMADGELVMAVLPATHHVELPMLGRLLDKSRVRLATEKEFSQAFPACDVGAMPPFGNLYNVAVWVDASLMKDPTIVFNAGTHADTIQMRYADFEHLVKPHVGTFATVTH